jgi:MYXO-CTERM domain-containing protein
VVIVMAIAGRHPLAPVVAATGGVSLAAGYVAAHFLPERAVFSDPLATAPSVTWLSWTSATVEVVAALALAGAGAVALARRRSDTHPMPARPLATIVRCPYVAAMVVGNVIIIGATLLRG